MRKIFKTILIFILFSSSYFYSQEIRFKDFRGIYLSPGVNISWDFNGNFIIGPKVSLGILNKGMFYNLTLGILSSKNNIIYPYYYMEGQIGKVSEITQSEFPLLSGFGIGVGYHTNDSNDKISYKLSLFSGYIVFINASVLYRNKIYSDLGFETVLPIPIKSIK